MSGEGEPSWAQPNQRQPPSPTATPAAAPAAASSRRRRVLFMRGLRLWTAGVAIALMVDAVIRVALRPYFLDGAVLEHGSGYEGELEPWSGTDLPAAGATRVTIATAEMLSALLLLAAELPSPLCARFVISYVGALATYGGKGCFMVVSGSTFALGGQTEYFATGVLLEHFITGCICAATGVVWLGLTALPCLRLPPHPTREAWLEWNRREVAPAPAASLELGAAKYGSGGGRAPPAAAIRIDTGAAVPDQSQPPSPGSTNPFFGNRHLQADSPTAMRV